MQFGNPIWLYGIFGILIPIVIHLWSKKEGRVIRVGSVRLFPEVESKQSQSIQLNEVLLLLLRILLIFVLTALLAELMLPKEGVDRSTVVLVDPDIQKDKRLQRALDTLNSNVKYLADGLPDFDEEFDKEKHALSPLWELSNQINQLTADTILIITSGKINHYKGKRPELAKAITLIQLDEAEPKSYQHRLFDTGFKLTGISDALSTKYRWSEAQGAGAESENWDTIHVSIKTSAEFKREGLYLKSALQAISDLCKRPISVNRSDGDVDLAIVLDETFNADKQVKTISWRPNEFEPIIYQDYNGDQWYLARRLNQQVMLEEDFVGQLLNCIIEQKQDENEIRQLSRDQIYRSTSMLNPEEESWARLDALWIVFLLLLGIERLLSMLKNQ